MATAGTAGQLPLFFMYTSPSLDHGWLCDCPGFAALRESPEGEGLAEVGFRRALVRHRRRTMSAREATLFYVPLWEYASSRLGSCNGTDHAARMRLAHHALGESTHWRRRQGADHVWASSKSQVPSVQIAGWMSHGSRGRSGWLSLYERMQPVATRLKPSIVGRYKHFAYHSMSWSAVGTCAIEIPYLANAAATRAAAAAPRTTLLHFAGSLDVCCAGSKVRCAVARLAGAEPAVVVRPTLRGALPGPCGQAALRGLANPSAPAVAAASAASAAEVAAASAAAAAGAAPQAADASRNASLSYRAMGEEMQQSIFCLTPPGDLPSARACTARWPPAASPCCSRTPPTPLRWGPLQALSTTRASASQWRAPPSCGTRVSWCARCGGCRQARWRRASVRSRRTGPICCTTTHCGSWAAGAAAWATTSSPRRRGASCKPKAGGARGDEVLQACLEIEDP